MRQCSSKLYVPLFKKGKSKTSINFIGATLTCCCHSLSVETGQNEAENTGWLVYSEYNYLIVKHRVEIMDCSLIHKETHASREQCAINWIALKWK